jgi:hypothetical protein
VQHAFPSVTRKEFQRENRIMHNDAIGSLSRAIADEDLGKLRRNTLMTQGLLGVGHVQHSQMDFGSHYKKPLEMLERSGDTSALKDTKNLRKAMRALPGYYGGIIASGAEHARAGLKGIASELDRLEPKKYKSDKATVGNAKTYGEALRGTLVRRIQKDHGKTKAEAEALIKERLRSFKPNAVERTAGGIMDAGQHAVQQVKRLQRLPGVMNERQRYLWDSAKTVLRGVLK